MHVLIADDEELVRLTLRCILDDAGYRVTEVDNGADAYGVIADEESTIDAVVTDIIMPDTKGTDTIAAIRAARPDLWIVAITGGGSIGNTDLRTRAVEAGADRVLIKPFDKQKLLEALERCSAA